MLKVDSREHKVIPFLKELSSDLEVINNMTRGDYVITNGDKIIHVFERKTMADLVSSMIGDTLHIDNMIKLREDTGCKLAFLIEHKTVFYDPDTYVKRVRYATIRGLLNQIYIKYDIPIIYTKSSYDTAKRLIEYVTLYDKLLAKVEGGDLSILKQKVIISNEVYLKKMWMCIPGVGESIATKLMLKYSFKTILKVKNIDELKLDDKKLTSNVCKGIKLLQNMDKLLWVKILSCVNGVSKTKACQILGYIDNTNQIGLIPELMINNKRITAIGNRILELLMLKLN